MNTTEMIVNIYTTKEDINLNNQEMSTIPLIRRLNHSMRSQSMFLRKKNKNLKKMKLRNSLKSKRTS